MRREALKGRDRERLALVAALDAAAMGHGAVAMISGPAGIGKSALAEALAVEVEERGLGVVRGRAWEFADAPPYFPVAPALRALGVEASGETNAFALWERVLGAIARVTASGPCPLVWLLDDLHAADLQTLDLLVFLAQPARSLPVLIVATARRADPRIDERAAQRLGRLYREAVDVRLGALAEDDVVSLAERWHGRPLGAAERARLVERAEGNPLFVVEMAQAARSLAASGAQSSIPEAIRQLVQDRVSRLPAATQRALAAGAVLGREFAAGTVAHMLGVLPARAVDDLSPALSAGLLVEVRPGSFVFGHVLERDAIEDGLSAAERARLHGAAEKSLALAGGAPSILLERARHALSSGADDESRTLELVDSVLTQLEEHGAFDRALSLHARLDEARRLGLITRAATPDELLRRASLARRAGHYAECRATCNDVMARARTEGDARTLSRAVLTAFGELRPGVVDAEAVAVLEEARAALGDADVALACRVEGRLAAALQPARDPMIVVERGRRAIERARATGDETLVADVLVTAGAAIVDYAPVAERIALARELADYAERSGDREKLLRACARLANDAVETGDFATFDGVVDRMLDVSMELGHPRHRWRPLIFASMRACMYGRFSESERYLVEVDQLAVLTDDPALPMALASHRGMRARDTESREALISGADWIDASLPGVPDAMQVGATLRAGLFVRAGDRERTAAALAQLDPTPTSFAMADPTFSLLSAEAVAFAGSNELRRTLRARIERLPALEIASGHVPMTYEGPVVRLRALLDESLGDLERAEERLREALARTRRHGFSPWVARIAAELGRLLEKRGLHDESLALLSESAALAERLGMPALRTGLPPAGGDAPPTARTVASAGDDVALERAGEAWQVRGEGRIIQVRDSRGMRLLARLIEHRGEELHVLVLASDEGIALAESDAGERIDEAALRAYRTRLVEIAADLDEAESACDAGRAERLRTERAALEDEIRGAVGLGGKARKAGSVTERARVNVQRRLKDALARIAEADAALGHRIALAVHTGTYCSFRP
jgi:hypothetical protein